MSTSATVQHTVQIRPGRLAGLVLAVATLTAATTWSVTNAMSDTRSNSPKGESSGYVAEVSALTPEQQAAIWGNVPSGEQHARTVSSLSPEELAAAYGNVSPTEQYVDGIVGMTPVERAAAFGNVSSTP
jgi:hypothetical protein